MSLIFSICLVFVIGYVFLQSVPWAIGGIIFVVVVKNFDTIVETIRDLWKGDDKES